MFQLKTPLSLLALVALLTLLPACNCLNGLTTSVPYTDGTFSCFASNFATYISVQAYTNFGTVNTAAVQNLKFARNRGFTTDITMYHCVNKDPVAQVTQMLNAVPTNLYDTVWISVMSNFNPGCGWTQNTPQKNCDYLRGLVGAVTSAGRKVGIFSSITEWTKIFQSSSFCYQLADLPLWYGTYDGDKHFTDFRAFGGWTTPMRKTFAAQYEMCGTNVNLNWSP